PAITPPPPIGYVAIAIVAPVTPTSATRAGSGAGDARRDAGRRETTREQRIAHLFARPVNARADGGYADLQRSGNHAIREVVADVHFVRQLERGRERVHR